MSATSNSIAERSACVACNAPAGGIVLQGLTPRNEDCALLRCSRCGHVYLDGWASDFDRELYAYYAPRVGKSRAEVYDPVNTRRQRELLDWLGARTSGRTLLDVGCGNGHLVDTASQAGWDALGIDLAKDAITIAQSFGVSCREEDFFSTALGAQRFDVITMSELIEHVPDPGGFLRRARSLLNPGGLLYLTTPNFASLGRRMMGGAWGPIHREHISYFTPRVLCDLAVRKAGLELVCAETRNFDPGVALAFASKLVSQRRATNNRNGVTHNDAAASPQDAGGGRAPVIQRVRGVIERSAALRAAKRALNAGLSTASVGDGLFVTFRR